MYKDTPKAKEYQRDYAKKWMAVPENRDKWNEYQREYKRKKRMEKAKEKLKEDGIE